MTPSQLNGGDPSIVVSLKRAIPRVEMPDIFFVAGLLEITSMGFLGQYAYAPNMQFLFGWEDADYRSRESGSYRGGARPSGPGRVVMLQGEKILWTRDVERPNDGAVSDNGYSIVNDWCLGQGLKGTFYAFARDGRVLIQEHFQANLFKAGIALDGLAAWCTTAGSDVDDDSNKLIAFSIAEPGKMLKIPQRRLEILGIRLIEGGVELQAAAASYRYNWQGELLNSAQVEKAEEEAIYDGGSSFELLALAQRKVAERPPQVMTRRDRTRVEALLRKVTEKHDPSPTTAARAERLLGEIALACGENQNAAAHFRSALRFDPSVGVKRLLSALESKIGA
jgi:hypothetical protein